jgi:hypothetical protein
MAATAGHRLTLGKCSNMNIMRYGVNVNETTTSKSNCIRNAFFSETINQTESKLHRILKHFPIRSNVKLSSAILNFISEQKT